MSEQAIPEEGHVLKTKAPLWMVATVAGVFGLLFAYSVWSAVASLIKITGANDLSGLGWLLVILPIVVPIVVYIGAVAFGYRRAVGEFALILLAGLALVQVYWMNTIALLATSGTTYLAM